MRLHAADRVVKAFPFLLGGPTWIGRMHPVNRGSRERVPKEMLLPNLFKNTLLFMQLILFFPRRSSQGI
jgi:hypothetical protein